MRIQSPDPQPRKDGGEYGTYVNGVAYGKPYGEIYLDEAGTLAIGAIALDDARRLARAAARVERELAAAHAQMAAPHGLRHVYQGTCQLCGREAGDPGALHGDPAAAPPGAAAVLERDTASGTQVIVRNGVEYAAPGGAA